MSAKLYATTVHCKEYRNEQKVYIYYAVDDNNNLITVSCNGCNFMRFDSDNCKFCKGTCTKNFVENWPILS